MVRYEKELEMTQTLNSIDLDIVKTLLARAARTLWMFYDNVSFQPAFNIRFNTRFTLL
jgi:hypothetical protein